MRVTFLSTPVLLSAGVKKISQNEADDFQASGLTCSHCEWSKVLSSNYIYIDLILLLDVGFQTFVWISIIILFSVDCLFPQFGNKLSQPTSYGQLDLRFREVASMHLRSLGFLDTQVGGLMLSHGCDIAWGSQKGHEPKVGIDCNERMIGSHFRVNSGDQRPQWILVQVFPGVKIFSNRKLSSRMTHFRSFEVVTIFFRLLLRCSGTGGCVSLTGSIGPIHILFGSFGTVEFKGPHQECESGGGLLPISGQKVDCAAMFGKKCSIY